MRITSIEPIVCDAGFGPRRTGDLGGMGRHGWIFVKITTDEGVTGWAEAYDWHAPPALAETIRVVGEEFIGADPRQIEKINQVVWAETRSGLPDRQRALGAIDIALWDIKAKWLGVPVYELLGGLYRDRIPLYWSHFAGYQLMSPDVRSGPPVETLQGWLELADEVKAAGYRALKLNPMMEGHPVEWGHMLDGWIDRETINGSVKLVGALRDRLGPDFGIAVDVGHWYRMGGAVQLARALEEFDLYWLEVEGFDPDALLEVKRQTRTRLCTGESLIRREAFLPFLQRHVTDVVMIETLNNGLSESRRIAELAALFDAMISPHNYLSPFGTLVNAHLCAAIPNVEILEYDAEDVPWKMDLITEPLRIERGELVVPSTPGFGADVNDEVVRAHPFQRFTP